jgi:hypothetical protein
LDEVFRSEIRRRTALELSPSVLDHHEILPIVEVRHRLKHCGLTVLCRRGTRIYNDTIPALKVAAWVIGDAS